MFWRKKDTPSAQMPAYRPPPIIIEGRPSRAPSADPEFNEALDTIAQILRARGRYAYSLATEDSIAAADQFEKWAKHLLVRSAPPSAPPGEESQAVEHRDWRGLVDFVGKRARQENEYVNGTIRDMRDTIFSLVESISRTSGVQGRNDALVKQRIAALGQAVETGSLESLKREAVAVAEVVTRALEEQRKIHEEQSAELKARLDSLGEQLEQTRRDVDTDGLTKVANRKAFDVALARALTVAGVVGRPVTLIMIDVDHFKSINDQHGHPGGDEVLKSIADALTRAFPRRSDLVARYGGEEFALILPDSGEAEVSMLAERVMNVIRALRVKLPSERTLAVTVSAGAAVGRTTETAAELVERADRALYQSKRAGRNRWCVAPIPRGFDAAAE